MTPMEAAILEELLQRQREALARQHMNTNIYRNGHPEQVRAAHLKWKSENKDHIRKYEREYYQKNRDRINKRRKELYQQRKQRFLEKTKRV